MIGADQRQPTGACTGATPLVRDIFGVRCAAGQVVGSTTADGWRRGGADRRAVMSVDRDGLRIRSLTDPGWGAATLSYGPFPQDHLAFAVLLLNGHNTAQHEPLGEPLRRRITRWMRGPETEPWPAHVWSWARRGPKRWTAHRFRHWWRLHRQERRGTLEVLDENLSVGLVPGPVSTDPLGEGYSFVMHATGTENGELWVRCSAGRRRVLRGVHNVPLYLLTVVSGNSVVHYAASLPAVHGLPALPRVRPVAVERRDPTLTVVHAALQQAVSGQIGFAADTRVWGAAVARLDPATFGRPVLGVALDDLTASRGSWTTEEPAGLIRVLADAGSTFTLDWRTTPAGTGWRISVHPDAVRLICRSADGDRELVRDELGVDRDEPLDVQVTDDGETIGVYVNGRLAFDRWITDVRFADGCGVAVDVHGRRGARQLAVHPRAVQPPEALSFPAPHLPRARDLVIDDDFSGLEADLDGRQVATYGGVRWRRSHGRGQFTTTRAGARVVASAATPLPGRTVYTLPWSAPGAVELEILVHPPGAARGEGHRGRAGVIFQQDEANALIVATWLDDVYGGASISSFSRSRGYEDLYDAIWTNVGARVQWGRPYRLRAAFDGRIYAAWLDDELVLYRSLNDVHPGHAPLRVRRVGIVANWEWGTDTGSIFRRFTARSELAGSTSTMVCENGRTV